MSATVETARRHAVAALAALDRVADDGSAESASRFSEGIAHLVRLRDAVIDDHRAGTDCRSWLDCSNSLLSLGFGIEYPVHGLQWQRVCGLRKALRDLLDSLPEASRDPGTNGRRSR